MSTVTEEQKQDIEERVKDLLRAIQLDVNLESSLSDNKIFFNVTGPDARFFLTNKDESLRGISYLLTHYGEKKYPEQDIEVRFDANRTLTDKEQELRAKAMNAYNSLKESGDEATIDALNPYDRRIVHMTLQELEGVESNSFGEGHFKKMRVRKL